MSVNATDRAMFEQHNSASSRSLAHGVMPDANSRYHRDSSFTLGRERLHCEHGQRRK